MPPISPFSPFPTTPPPPPPPPPPPSFGSTVIADDPRNTAYYYSPPIIRRYGQDTTNMPTGTFALPYVGNGPASGDLYSRLESRSTLSEQAPTRVFQGADRMIGNQIQPYINQATGLLYGTNLPQFQNLSLNQSFLGSGNMDNRLSGGIDYFGRLGMSEGAQNIMAQQNRANQAIADQLGRNPGNAGLLSVLQNQNRMRSQLAMNPLISEAQRGTYDRAGQSIALENAAIQMQNQARQAQLGFNNQNLQNRFQNQLQGMQPYQNLLEFLSALQGQARGLQSGEGSFAGKNYQ